MTAALVLAVLLAALPAADRSAAAGVVRLIEERSIPSLLLSGKGDILGQFTAELETPPGEGLLRLRLTPRKPEPEIESVTVDVEPSGRVRQIQVDDGQGNRSRFRFDDIRENV